MCGLFGGMSSWLSSGEIGNIIDIAAISAVRGKDSTGITLVHMDKKKEKFRCETVRDVVNPVSFFLEDGIKENLIKMQPAAIMGHCRLATIGTVNMHNAHPICEDHIIGCHNGTIPKFRPAKEKEDEDSDSRHLFRLIAEQGLEAALKETAGGAYALTFINKKEGTLNLIRNEQRPLWIMYGGGSTTVYWASEKWILQGLSEHAFSYFQEPVQVPVNTLITFKIGKATYTKQEMKVNFTKDIVREVFERWKDKNTHQPIHPTLPMKTTGTNHELDPLAGSMLRPGLSASVPSIKLAKDLPPGVWYNGYNNNYRTVGAIAAVLKASTCTLCTHQGTVFDKVWWHTEEDYICDTCKNEYDHQDWMGTLHEGKLKGLK
jgi:hypothetical protein